MTSFKLGVIKNMAEEVKTYLDSNEDMHYLDKLHALQDKYGGEIWNSGGNCYILSIENPKNTTRTKGFECLHINNECFVLYKSNNRDDVRSLNNFEKLKILFEYYL